MYRDKRLFSKLFERVDLDSLSWSEVYRRDLRKKYDIGPDDEIPKWIQDRMPDRKLEGEFSYNLILPKAEVSFSQSLSERTPMYNGWDLFFMFGTWYNPDNVSAVFSPQYADVKLNFGIFDYMDAVDMQSQNIDIIPPRFERGFTRLGETMMQNFFSCFETLREIKGMLKEDSEKLEVLLERVRTQYDSVNLNPSCWNYGV